MNTKAQMWGNSLAVRVPRVVAEKAGLRPEDPIDIEVLRGKIVLTRATKPIRRTYPLDSLVKKITTKNRYKVIDFGKPTGREAW